MTELGPPQAARHNYVHSCGFAEQKPARSDQRSQAKRDFEERIKGGAWHSLMVGQLIDQIEGCRRRLETCAAWRDCLQAQAELKAYQRILDQIT